MAPDRLYAPFRACVLDHVRSQAALVKRQSFEAVELGLRPACGEHLSALRRALAADNQGNSQIDRVVRTLYARDRARLKAAFDQAVAAGRSVNPAPAMVMAGLPADRLPPDEPAEGTAAASFAPAAPAVRLQGGTAKPVPRPVERARDPDGKPRKDVIAPGARPPARIVMVPPAGEPAPRVGPTPALVTVVPEPQRDMPALLVRLDGIAAIDRLPDGLPETVAPVQETRAAAVLAGVPMPDDTGVLDGSALTALVARSAAARAVQTVTPPRQDPTPLPDVSARASGPPPQPGQTATVVAGAAEARALVGVLPVVDLAPGPKLPSGRPAPAQPPAALHGPERPSPLTARVVAPAPIARVPNRSVLPQLDAVIDLHRQCLIREIAALIPQTRASGDALAQQATSRCADLESRRIELEAEVEGDPDTGRAREEVAMLTRMEVLARIRQLRPEGL